MALHLVGTALYVFLSPYKKPWNTEPTNSLSLQDRGNECRYPPHTRRRPKHRNETATRPRLLNHSTVPVGQIWIEERRGDTYRTETQDDYMGTEMTTRTEPLTSSRLPQPSVFGLSPQESVKARSTQPSMDISTGSHFAEDRFSSKAAPLEASGNGTVEALTPEESEFDREEATIDLKDVRYSNL